MDNPWRNFCPKSSVSNVDRSLHTNAPFFEKMSKADVKGKYRSRLKGINTKVHEWIENFFLFHISLSPFEIEIQKRRIYFCLASEQSIIGFVNVVES